MTDYRHFYNKRQWRRRSQAQKRRAPLCQICLSEGQITPAEISDHVQPHKGNINSFILGELQSLCRHHHESTKKIIEQRGYDPRVGEDGWPVDQNHPCYRR
jgi:5-methylcytosine-specific restriction enzyme A